MYRLQLKTYLPAALLALFSVAAQANVIVGAPFALSGPVAEQAKAMRPPG